MNIQTAIIEISRGARWFSDKSFTISVVGNKHQSGLNFVLDWPKTVDEIIEYLADNLSLTHLAIYYRLHPCENNDVFGNNISLWKASSVVAGLFTRDIDVASFNKQRNLAMLKDMRARKNNVKMFNWDEKELAYPLQYFIQIENIFGEELYIVYSDDMLPEEFSSVKDALLWLGKQHDTGTKLQLTHVTSDIREIFTDENVVGMVDVTSDNNECLSFRCGEIVYE